MFHEHYRSKRYEKFRVLGMERHVGGQTVCDYGRALRVANKNGFDVVFPRISHVFQAGWQIEIGELCQTEIPKRRVRLRIKP